jgi:hypothetical protein
MPLCFDLVHVLLTLHELDELDFYQCSVPLAIAGMVVHWRQEFPHLSLTTHQNLTRQFETPVSDNSQHGSTLLACIHSFLGSLFTLTHCVFVCAFFVVLTLFTL